MKSVTEALIRGNTGIRKSYECMNIELKMTCLCNRAVITDVGGGVFI